MELGRGVTFLLMQSLRLKRREPTMESTTVSSSQSFITILDDMIGIEHGS